MQALLEAPEPVVEQPAEQPLIDRLIIPGYYEEMLRVLKPTAHPLLPIPTCDDCIAFLRIQDEEKLVLLFKKREEAIASEKVDPLHCGFEPQMWLDADALMEQCKDILVVGSNRGTKSTWAAKRCVQLALRKPGANIWAFTTSNEVSIRDQQKMVYHFLPVEMRRTRKWGNSRALYSQAKGFSDRVIVFPKGSEIRFMNYQQDGEVIEGGQIDLWWADENIPLDWIVTLRGRTIDRKGKGVVTYTPIEGFTPNIGEYFTGALVTKWTDSDVYQNLKLWPGGEKGKVPYIMECLNSRHAVIFFQSRWNPYIDYQELLNTWKDKPMAVALVRIHGVTQKTCGNVFPRFGKHNILSHEKIEEEFKKQPPTRYHCIDFAWNRNWCMLWAGVQRFKDRRRIFIYREWPDFDTYAEWVIPSDKPDGARGPAQSSLGYGIVDYKRLIKDLETTRTENTGTTETIYTRYGDPRSGAAQSLAEEGATTIIDMLAGTEGGMEPMIVEAAAGKDGMSHIRDGVNLINQWLEYDPDKPMVALRNEPQLYISERCQNLITCMKIWTGLDGDKGASKDFCDVLRYLSVMDIDFHSPDEPSFYGGGAY